MVSKWIVYILGLIALFCISSSFVYMYEYYEVVRHTFNETSRTYEFRYPYPELYLYNSYAWILFIMVSIVWVIWFFYKNICKDD